MNEKKIEINDVLKSIKNLINDTPSHEDILELTNIVEFGNNDEVKAKKKLSVSENTQSDTNINSYDHLFKNIKQLISISSKMNNRSVAPELGDNSMEVFIAKLVEPQIKQWLKENLPSIVNVVVEKEIQKLLHDDKG
ncbi:MAG: DUF2497 domain-containing protein [Rickettsiaceae bacterium]|nr:DUF2497 domain-containing protein [Rickettsiaceae bacterium]